jgi:2-alkyl-3-oxoalkanoate reductase
MCLQAESGNARFHDAPEIAITRGDELKALVTGATGFVGSYLVRSLLQRGDQVRILARNADRAAPLRNVGAEVRLGDLGSATSLRGIADGMDALFHLGSVIRGSTADFERVDIQGTERLLAEAQRAGVRRYVYASTLAGYPPDEMRANCVIDESWPLDSTGLLGNYARAKAHCEKAVLAANAGGKTECVVLRLGLVCGIGANVFPAHVCKVIGRNWVVMFGDGDVPLPLIVVDNAVDALILGATVPHIGGETFNIVDDDVLTQLGYLNLLRSCTGGLPHVLRLPVSAYYLLGFLSELLATARGKEPETTRYRIRGRLARVHWNCSKAQRVLHWQPRVSLQEGLEPSFRLHATPIPRA